MNKRRRPGALPTQYQAILSKGIAALRLAEADLAMCIDSRDEPSLWLELRDIRGLANRLTEHGPYAWTEEYMLTALSPLDVAAIERYEANHSPARIEDLSELRRFLSDYLGL